MATFCILNFSNPIPKILIGYPSILNNCFWRNIKRSEICRFVTKGNPLLFSGLVTYQKNCRNHALLFTLWSHKSILQKTEIRFRLSLVGLWFGQKRKFSANLEFDQKSSKIKKHLRLFQDILRNVFETKIKVAKLFWK